MKVEEGSDGFVGDEDREAEENSYCPEETLVADGEEGVNTVDGENLLFHHKLGCSEELGEKDKEDANEDRSGLRLIN